MDKIDELIEMSKYAGMREDLIQAGGGNTSVKLDDHRMLVKSSGYQLADLTREEGYAIVDYAKIVNYFDVNKIEDILKTDEKKIIQDALIEGKRPSIETFLHAITEKYTLHTHPMVINVLTARKDGMNILKELFPDALLVAYETPGIDLAKKYFQSFKESENHFNVIFLKNHGMVVSADNLNDIYLTTEKVLKKVADFLKINISPAENATCLWKSLKKCFPQEDNVVFLTKDYMVREFVRKYRGSEFRYTFSPDCVVYAGNEVLYLKKGYEDIVIEEFANDKGFPVLINYENELYIVASNIKKAKEIESVVSFATQVVMNNINYEMDLLSEEEKIKLLNWDMEKYRKTMK